MLIPETKYARSGELAIAYQVHGDGPYDVLFSGTTASNVETVWTLPEAHRLNERLGRFARIIRYDRRDTGISDPIKDDLTLEAHAADALAVMDAAQSEQAVGLGGSDGARSLAALAALHPERVSRLIAVAPTVGGGAAAAPEVAAAAAESIAGLDWPHAMMHLWTPNWIDDPVRLDRAERYIRTSPRRARRAGWSRCRCEATCGRCCRSSRRQRSSSSPIAPPSPARHARSSQNSCQRVVRGHPRCQRPVPLCPGYRRPRRQDRRVRDRHRASAALQPRPCLGALHRPRRVDSARAARRRPCLDQPAGAPPRRRRGGGHRVRRRGHQDPRGRCARRVLRPGAGRALRTRDRRGRPRPRLEVRSGVHTGEIERTGADVAGPPSTSQRASPAVPRAARSCARAPSKTSSWAASCASRRAANAS